MREKSFHNRIIMSEEHHVWGQNVINEEPCNSLSICMGNSKRFWPTTRVFCEDNDITISSVGKWKGPKQTTASRSKAFSTGMGRSGALCVFCVDFFIAQSTQLLHHLSMSRNILRQ